METFSPHIAQGLVASLGGAAPSSGGLAETPGKVDQESGALASVCCRARRMVRLGWGGEGLGGEGGEGGCQKCRSA